MALQSFDKAYENDNRPFMISIDGKDYEGFLTNIRVDKETLPEGWYAYDLGEGYDDICEVKNGKISFNYFGTFCTQSMLPLTHGEALCRDRDILEFDYSFI